MPYRVIHPVTGFVEFRKTPEEKMLESVVEENTRLKAENEKINKDLELIKAKLGLTDSNE